ncbi:MAG TPA: hypothetical protein VMT50_04890 [Steroidobacteraceae bacterium]|nr:hypothetical protein [Steroidobacteraceae bacterium]
MNKPRTFRPSVLLVVGPWGSGTTGVMASLVALGAYVPGPWWMTADPRMPNSLETAGFRDLLHTLVDEETVSVVRPEAVTTMLRDYARIVGSLQSRMYRPIALKHALAAALLPMLDRVFELRVIYVMRPIADIAATHRRRDWAAHFGTDGAHRIYALMDRYRPALKRAPHVVHYTKLLEDPESTLKSMAEFARLRYKPTAMTAITRPGAPSPEAPAN